MPSRRTGLNPLDTNSSALFSSNQPQTPTATTSTATTSRSTSPTSSTSHHNGGGGATDQYCQSPDSFYPPPTTSIGPTQASLPRRRDTSTVIGMNATGGGGGTNQTSVKESNLARRHSPASSPQASLPRNEIPFIGGGFSRSLPAAKRASMSNHGVAYFGRGKRARCTRLLGLVVGVVLIWWVATNWRGEKEPRRKLVNRWWEQEDSLSPGSASLFLTLLDLSRSSYSPHSNRRSIRTLTSTKTEFPSTTPQTTTSRFLSHSLATPQTPFDALDFLSLFPFQF